MEIRKSKLDTTKVENRDGRPARQAEGVLFGWNLAAGKFSRTAFRFQFLISIFQFPRESFGGEGKQRGRECD